MAAHISTLSIGRLYTFQPCRCRNTYLESQGIMQCVIMEKRGGKKGRTKSKRKRGKNKWVLSGAMQ